MACKHSNPATRLRQVLLACLILISGLATAGFGPPVLSDGGYPALRFYPEQVQQMARLAQPPALTAAAALLVDVDSGQTLYALHEHEARPPASTAKLMTALLVLRNGKLDERVTVSAKAAGTGGSTMSLRAGEQLTVGELLAGLMIPSGNDAAVALAEHISGDEPAFVALMNQTAAQMELRETHFSDPDGLDDAGNTSSAADLMHLARADLAYPEFARIVALAAADVAGHHLVNTNLLLGNYPGADGVKTGTTDLAGECLVASATRKGHRLLLVVLGSRDRYADARALLDYAAAGWQWRTFTLPNDALAATVGRDGRAYRLRATETVEVFLPAWQWPLTRPLRVLDAADTLSSTLPVGSLLLTYDGQTLARVPLATWPAP